MLYHRAMWISKNTYHQALSDQSRKAVRASGAAVPGYLANILSALHAQGEHERAHAVESELKCYCGDPTPGGGLE